MTIVVLVKQVPDMNSVRIDKATGHASTSGKAMNSLDAYAVQEALNLREVFGGEVVAVSASPTTAKDALTRALAMGADRGVHVELSDQADRDSLDMAHLLAVAMKPLNPKVVLCGQQSDDVETGQIGPQLAELLGMPHISYVVEIDVEGEALRMRRDTEGGYQPVSVPLPVVIMMQPGLEQPTFPSIKGMMAAKRKPVDKVVAEAATGGKRLSWSEPKVPDRDAGWILLQGESAQDAAKKLVQWMTENKLISG